MDTFERYESEVRGYCRAFPVVFETARGATLRTEDGQEYLDFFAGAGVLNYGHNNPALKDKLLEYIQSDGITHSLDMYSVAKRRFLERFNEVILQPRDMDYRIQFPGPTGTNAVEAALKLARKVTGRDKIVSFTNGFHGMTLGALAVTGNAWKRKGAGVTLTHVDAMPFDGFLGEADSLAYFDAFLKDAGSGVDKPAAVILETVQAEGGVNVASTEWLQRLEKLCREHEILLIVDDIQVGCGRTGRFFSFEDAGIRPDIITLSKSLSGYGLPFAIDLIRPDLDIWEPGEHNGTFRGHNPAFVTATAALEFWRDDELAEGTLRKGGIAAERLTRIAQEYPALKARSRGRGLILGLECAVDGAAGKLSQLCFEKGLIIETAGTEDQVLKLLPPLVISDEELARGLDIIEESARELAAAIEKDGDRAVA